MNKHSTIALDRRSTDFIDQQIEEGNFHSASEVVQAGLELLEERQAQIERLRAAIIEGEESGPSTPFDFDAFLARKHRERGL
ncbi:MAG: type II toxin-antitoxin system ParD family antitoxin [Mesorhizobium sp.]|nr:type II toxin-antitoxin system ParD family antitoxin [Mesorhizobium sp.]